MERHPELREFQKDLREEIVEKAESNLMIGLRQGRQWATEHVHALDRPENG